MDCHVARTSLESPSGTYAEVGAAATGAATGAAAGAGTAATGALTAAAGAAAAAGVGLGGVGGSSNTGLALEKCYKNALNRRTQ